MGGILPLLCETAVSAITNGEGETTKRGEMSSGETVKAS